MVLEDSGTHFGSIWEMHEVKVQEVQFQVLKCPFAGSPHQRWNVEGAPQLWKNNLYSEPVGVGHILG